MKTMSRLSAAERRQQNVGSRASAAARGHGRACRRCDNNLLTLKCTLGLCLVGWMVLLAPFAFVGESIKFPLPPTVVAVLLFANHTDAIVGPLPEVPFFFGNCLTLEVIS